MSGALNGFVLNGAALNGSPPAEGPLLDEMLSLGLTMTPKVITRLREALQVLSMHRGLAPIQSASLVEAFRLAELYGTSLDAALSDAMTFAASHDGDVVRIGRLIDAMVMSESFGGSHTAVATLAVMLMLGGGFTGTRLGRLAEAIIADAELATRLIAKATMLEAMVLADAIAGGRIVAVRLSESLTLAAADGAKALYTAFLAENMGVGVDLFIAGDQYDAWVVNTETNAASEYENFPFNSMAKLGTRYYGASEGGLYLLGGDDDDGDPIEARIKTGEMDFGTTEIKRLEKLYLGYTTTGDLVLKVTVTHGGKHTEYWYKAVMPTKDPTEVKVPIGRDLTSGYFQFELVNDRGADFEIDRMNLLLLNLNRRV